MGEPSILLRELWALHLLSVWGPSMGHPWPAFPEWVAWGRLAHPVAVYPGEPPGGWTRVH